MINYLIVSDCPQADQLRWSRLESHAGTSGRATSNVPQLTPGIGYEFKVAQSVTFCYGDLCPKTN